MSEKQLFWVKIPERPTGKAIAACFDSLVNQMVASGVFENPVSRLKVNVEEKQIEIEVKGGMSGG
ncbi:hypothetical protein [Pueribacillus sp. YX66]|uniref:hypothetical protein n=1 Tax=Pueribacillus sp. YX66 TaxID=3229242 RepID=UPI00358D163B